MKAMMRFVAFLFTHYITPLGIRVLSDMGTVDRVVGENIQAGTVRPYFANHINDGEFEFLYLPLYSVVEGERVQNVGMPVDGSNRLMFSESLMAESPYDLETLNLVDYFWWVTDNDNLVIQLRGNPLLSGKMVVKDSPKSAKRLKEYYRLVNAASIGRPVMSQLSHYEHDDTDGRAAVSVDFVCRMILAGANGRDLKVVRRELGKVKSGEINTVLLRTMGPDGLLKVEANIVNELGTDLRFHWKEWKKEVQVSDWFTHIELKAHTHGPAYMDIQTASWLQNWMFPEAVMRECVSAMFDRAREAVRANEIPAWMISEVEMNENGEFALGHSRDLQDQHKSYIKWQSHGLRINQSANMVYMAFQSLISRVEASDLFIPVPWAVRAHVCTQAFVTEVCGYDIPEEYKDVVYFDERVNCLVYPTELFLALAANHGGWDQDGDSVVIALRMVKGEDRMVAVVWRNPNSPGEYAIVDVAEDTIPWEFTDLVEIPEIDLTTRPAFIDEVRATQDLRELLAADKASGEWTNEMSMRELETQLANPGIGRVANALMVYAAITGGSSPEWMYAMEDMVDTCMQTRFLPAFEQIEEWLEYMYTQINAQGRIDGFLAGKCSIGGRKIKPRLPADVMDGMARYDGYFTRLHNHVKEELALFREDLEKESFRIRALNPIGNLADEVDGFFSEAERPLVKRGRKMVDWANEEFSAAAIAFPRSKDESDPLNKARRSAANRKVIDDCVVTLQKVTKAERSIMLIAAYRYCMERSPNKPLGNVDRVLYAYGSADKKTVMDLWLDTLVETGDATTSALWSAAIEAELDGLMNSIRNLT